MCECTHTHTHTRGERGGKWGFESLTVVEGDDVENVHQLSLVLVDPLHLDVKQRLWVDLHSVCLLQILGKTPLVLLTHTHTNRQWPMAPLCVWF